MGITSVPLAKADATVDTAVVRFDETRKGLTCLDPEGTGTGSFSVVEIIHVTEDPQGMSRRAFTAETEFTYVTSGVTFSGHEIFHSTVTWLPDGSLMSRIVAFSGHARGSNGSLTMWSGLSVSVDDTVLHNRFECVTSLVDAISS